MREAVGRNGQSIIEQHGWLRHLPGEECLRAQTFAVVRHKAKGGVDMFWNYAYVVGGGKLQIEKIHEPAAARLVFERHHLKGKFLRFPSKIGSGHCGQLLTSPHRGIRDGIVMIELPSEIL